MTRYISGEEAQILDEKLFEMGFTVEGLVEAAGYAAFEAITGILQQKNKTILVVIGPRNNGSDGLVIARYLKLVGDTVEIFMCSKNISSLSETLVNICKNMEVPIHQKIPNTDYDYVIDSIFGFGFKGELRSPYLDVINWFSTLKNVIAIDVPSGYSVDGDNRQQKYKPKFVVALTAPKSCCVNLKCYVARSFVPKNIYFDSKYTNFFTFTELENVL